MDRESNDSQSILAERQGFLLRKRFEITPPQGSHPYLHTKKSSRMAAFGGETGIRTLGARKGTTVFETAPIDHSGISPVEWLLRCKGSD